jgi:hypothetical protein
MAKDRAVSAVQPKNLICNFRAPTLKQFQQWKAYVLNKARDLTREFSYRDFLELKHDAFRRIILHLRRKGKIVANPQRTIPRFYFLAERISEYTRDGRTTQ